MAALKAQKEMELQVHENLYNNLYLLKLKFPAPPELETILKKDMFVKNNKLAFQQVVYYLLKILDPVKLREKIKSWPLYDVKMENEFRNDIAKYLNELNKIYEDADIPTVMTSHLISPGGFKFVKLMLKLSMLVMKEHLTRTGCLDAGLLCLCQGAKDKNLTEKVIQIVEDKTAEINNATKASKENFLQIKEQLAEEANKIKIMQEELKVVVPRKEEKCKEMLEELKTISNSTNENSEVIYKRFENIDSTIKTLEGTLLQFKRYCSLIEYLQNEDLFLKNKMNEGKILDLLAVIKEFHKCLDRKKREILSVGSEEVLETLQIFVEVNRDFSDVLGKLNDIHGKLTEVLQLVDENKVRAEETVRKPINQRVLPQEDFMESPLAVPLEASLENKENLVE